MRAFRIRGAVHWGLLPGLVAGAIVVVLGAFTVVRQASYGVASVGFLAGLLLVLGATLALIGFVWQALVAYGWLPFVVVWRRGGKVWAGTLLALLWLDPRRIALDVHDVRVEMVRVHNGRDGSPMVFDVRLASAGVGILLRTRGAVDVRALQEFLVASADPLGVERRYP